MHDATTSWLVCSECDGLFAGTHDLDWHLYHDHLFSRTDRFIWSLRKEKHAPPERVQELTESRKGEIESGSAGRGLVHGATSPADSRHPRPTAGQRMAIRLMRG
ncbi:MAG: hypothetical protein ACXV3F_06630 [Frankiaceae bacterium]